MRSGRLKRQVTIQSLAPGSPRQSASGQRVDQWTNFATVRANLRPLSARERHAAMQAQSEVDVEIEIRYLAGIVGGGAMRVLHLGVYYVIHGVRDPEMDQFRLLLDCSTGVVNDAVDVQ
jgi:SPP1 family predicted phage head-tail adaptor